MTIKKHVVAIIIYNNKKEILLQKRWKYSKYGEERSFFWWSIEQWESTLSAIKREIKEELWIKIIEEELLYLWQTKHFIIAHQTNYIRDIYAIKSSQEEYIDNEAYWAHFIHIGQIKKLKMITNITQEYEIIKTLFSNNLNTIDM